MSKETAKEPKKKKSFNKKKLKYGSVATVITVVFIAVIVFINLIAGILTERKGLKLDLTPEKYYDISQQTIDYSVQFIFWNCPFEWSLAMLFIYRGTIQGLKNGIVPMIGSLIEVVMRIMAPVIFSSVIGYASICVAGPAAWTGSMLLMIAVYYVKIRKLSKTKTVVAN